MVCMSACKILCNNVHSKLTADMNIQNRGRCVFFLFRMVVLTCPRSFWKLFHQNPHFVFIFFQLWVAAAASVTGVNEQYILKCEYF